MLVDGANVVGSVPDGWWRDRPGAAARLHARLVELGEQAVLVLEGAARDGVPEGVARTVQVVHATGSGDDALVALAGPGTVLVSADRVLRRRCEQRGATCTGPGALLARLPDPGEPPGAGASPGACR